MCSLNPVYVDIIVCKYGAAYGRYGNRLGCHAHLFDDLGNQLVDRTVATARTIVHYIILDELRLTEYQVLRFDFYYFCHSFTIY